MLRMSLQLEMGTFSAAVCGLVGVAFGMNLDSSLEGVCTYVHRHVHVAMKKIFAALLHDCARVTICQLLSFHPLMSWIHVECLCVLDGDWFHLHHHRPLMVTIAGVSGEKPGESICFCLYRRCCRVS